MGVPAVFLLTADLQPESDTLPLSFGNTSVHSAGIPEPCSAGCYHHDSLLGHTSFPGTSVKR